MHIPDRPRDSTCVGIAALVAGLAVAPALALTYAVAREPFHPVLRRRGLLVPGTWPSMSILHLSDLHVRTRARRLFRAQADVLRGLAPDVCVVTGDVCETPADVDRTLELLSLVRPRFGTFVVLGNHEHDAHRPYSATARTPRWASLVRQAIGLVAPREHREPGQAALIAERLAAGGIDVLLNRGTRLDVRGRGVWIAGCDSAWAGTADMHRAMRGHAEGEACLALIHEPELAFAAHSFGADLILAGHTHGGQVRLPWLGAPYSHRVDRRIRIASGVQQIGRSVLHISAGLGQTVPLRFACSPEAVWLDCLPVSAAERLDANATAAA